jgi:D-arginine dehydrogenase
MRQRARRDMPALQQGFLRRLRAHGGVLALRHRAGRIERRDGTWDVHTNAGDVFRAPVVVNAAGAWGDEVAGIAGVARLGLTPCRRTGVIIDPTPWHVDHWPLLNDVHQTWYARTEARTRLMVSPADQTPMHPHDVQPDEMDVAIAIDRMQQALDITVQRVERSWSGLRTFTQDGSLAFGWDRAGEGFFWCVGQGGYWHPDLAGRWAAGGGPGRRARPRCGVRYRRGDRSGAVRRPVACAGPTPSVRPRARTDADPARCAG